MERESSLVKAFELSDLTYSRERERILSELKEDLHRIKQEMTSRGIFHSGIHIQQRFRRQVKAITELMNCRINLDLETVNEITDFISINISEKVYQRAKQVIERETDNFKTQMSEFCSSIQAGSHVVSSMLNRIGDEKDKLLDNAKRDIEIHRKKSELELPKSGLPRSVLNIDLFQMKQFQLSLSDICRSLKSISYPIINDIAKRYSTISEQYGKALKNIVEEYQKLNFSQINEVFKTAKLPVIDSQRHFEKLARESAQLFMKIKELQINTAYPFRALEHITSTQKDLLSSYLPYVQPKSQPVEIESLEVEDGDELDMLLDGIAPALKKKRAGAWQTFNSNNPDRLSQAASSMVELLSQVIQRACKGKKLGEFLKVKCRDELWGVFGKEETKWVEVTVKWISETKDKLERVKHHADYRSENIAKTLLISCERVILIVLE